MTETMIFRPVEGTEHLTVKTLKVFQAIQREIGDRTERVDYTAIGREKDISMTRNGVKYAVETLVKAGCLSKKDGKLSVLKRIVL